jgi:hypothetical protein
MMRAIPRSNEIRARRPVVHFPYLEHLIQQRVEAWVARGRTEQAPISQDGTWSLRFGVRDQIRMIIVSLILGGFCGLALWFDQTVQPLGFWLRVGYGGFLFPAFLLSVLVAIQIFTTNVILSDWGIVFAATEGSGEQRPGRSFARSVIARDPHRS